MRKQAEAPKRSSLLWNKGSFVGALSDVVLFPCWTNATAKTIENADQIIKSS